ncbi:MAG TPA: GDP-mannose 4,6-dehydratase [Kofleriaceae bacterium]
MNGAAVIIGSAGQDGTLLARAIGSEREVIGVDVGDLDVTDTASVTGAIARIRPAQLYYLAAAHHSSEERIELSSELRRGFDVHVRGCANVLEAVARHAPECRVFFAGSSQMFGTPREPTQDETTPFAPRTPYGITKVAGAHVCHAYRERGLHVSVGILYNHESPLRGPRFVSQRIARGVHAARRSGTKLRLGALDAVCDWGYAPDFVDAMRRIVEQAAPDDYVVASGEGHTVRELAAIAFEHVGLDLDSYVEVDANFVQTSGAIIVGNTARLRSRTGWRPTVTFEQLVRLLVAAAEAT